MSREVVFYELCGVHREFRAVYQYDFHGRPIRLKALKRFVGHRKTVVTNRQLENVCALGRDTNKIVDVARNTKSKRKRRQLVGGKGR